MVSFPDTLSGYVPRNIRNEQSPSSMSSMENNAIFFTPVSNWSELLSQECTTRANTMTHFHNSFYLMATLMSSSTPSAILRILCQRSKCRDILIAYLEDTRRRRAMHASCLLRSGSQSRNGLPPLKRLDDRGAGLMVRRRHRSMGIGRRSQDCSRFR